MGFKTYYTDSDSFEKSTKCNILMGCSVLFSLLGMILVVLVILTFPIVNNTPVLTLNNEIVLPILFGAAILIFCSIIFALFGKKNHNDSYYSLETSIEKELVENE